MRARVFVVAAVLASLAGGFVLPAQAADPALVAAFERHLTPLEKAILASVLTDSTNSAEFDADMREAQRDAASLAAAVAKWRLRMAEFSQRDRNAPNPNLEGTYRTYPEMLTPPIRAYLARRLRDLRDRSGSDSQAREAYETLRDYLAGVQESLDDDGKLSWYTKRVVAGIMDKYRSELVEFLGTENARRALRDGPAAVAELARRRAATAAAAEEARRAAARPPARGSGEPAVVPPAEERPAPTLPPVAVVVPPVLPSVPAVNETPAQRTAREQAEAAERTARAGNPGAVFDGGGLVVGETGDPVAVPGGGAATPRPGADLAAPGSPAGNLAGPRTTPPEMSSEDELLSSIRGPRGRGSKSWKEYTPQIGGAAVGALVGFLVGGPFGALFGALLGFIGGDIAAKSLFK